MPKRLTTEKFIVKAREVHGDLYDYSKVVYVKSLIKVTIIDPQYGEFDQVPNSHLSGSGHPIRARLNIKNKRKMTTEEFIAIAKDVHGDRFDYSKSKYSNATTNVKIICKVHGIFEQNPRNHIKGIGCAKCSGIINKKLTTEVFIERSKAIFGDIFDYSITEYKNVRSKVKIICKEHGEFEQNAHGHLDGKNGCKQCQIDNRGYTHQDFIDKAKATHRDRYDYSLVEYLNAYTKVDIICREHGVFEQLPSQHINGSNCPLCVIGNYTSTTQEFIDKANEVHNGIYDYSLVKYDNAHIKVDIICEDHGVFSQKPCNHIGLGRGCPKCKGGVQYSQEEFLEKAKATHGNKYDYSLVDYKNSRNKLKIKCNTCNKIFLQAGESHIGGRGCPSCAVSGFDPTKPAILYYLAVNNGAYYKIGITNKTVKERYTKRDLEKIRVVKEWNYPIGYDAREKELWIINEFPDARYKGDAIFLDTAQGNAEMFIYDVLGLDTGLKLSPTS